MADLKNITHGLSTLMIHQRDELKNLKLGTILADKIEKLSTSDLTTLHEVVTSDNSLCRNIQRKPIDHIQVLVQADINFRNFIRILDKIGLLRKDPATRHQLEEIHSTFNLLRKSMRSLKIVERSSGSLKVKATLEAVSSLLSEAKEESETDKEIAQIQKLIETQLKAVEIASDNLKSKVGTQVDYEREQNRLKSYQNALTELLLKKHNGKSPND
ncbi:MAG: hypothetical protein P4M08_01380 [Oligoflexia bacterium]|nr:hypothetical protein [Oligoflexia bacterium]